MQKIRLDNVKYHYSGHRDCGVIYSPEELTKKGPVCPVCKRELTIGVMQRVEELATRSVADLKLKKVNGRIFNYILEFNKEIVYIGYSSNLYLRLVQHKGTKYFETITLIEFSNKQTARLMEKTLIKKYRPIDNYQYLR